MKKINTALFIASLIFLTSCATTVKFPVSTVTPAADIKAKKKADKNGNINISVNAVNLASADRLDPSKNVYVAWIITTSDGTRNLGQLTYKNNNTASIETITPFPFTEIFITAESQKDISYPSGIEITRAKFKK